MTPTNQNPFADGSYGNDRFNATNGHFSDAGGFDQLTLSGVFSDYSAGLVGHRHLLLSNQQTGDNVLVLDWRGQGRIESFVDASGQQVFEGQMEQALFAPAYGQHFGPGSHPLEGLTGLGNIPTAQAMETLGETDLSPMQFLNQLSINAKLAQLDLHEVAAELTGDASDNADIGQAFATAAQHHLSPQEQQTWHELNYDEKLAQTDYEGLDLSGFINDDETGNDDADDEAENDETDTDSDDDLDEDEDEDEDEDSDDDDVDGDDNQQDGGHQASIDAETASLLSDLFQAVLDRPLHNAEHTEWAHELADGDNLADIADDFLDFDEYEARFETDNDQAFISQSFDHLLGRAPGAEELDAWTNQLESGVDREDMLVDFVTAANENADVVGVSQPADIAIG